MRYGAAEGRVFELFKFMSKCFLRRWMMVGIAECVLEDESSGCSDGERD